MNVREVILSNQNVLSPQELMVAQWLVDNLEVVQNLSMKNICKRLKVQESVISKTLQKVGLEGFKNFKKVLKSSPYLVPLENLENFFNDWYENLNLDLKRTFQELNFKDLETVAKKIINEQKAIIIFATGKSKIMANFFYFTLLEYGYDVEIYSSLYEPNAFKVENKLVFVISLSGQNSKVSRYINLLTNHKKPGLEIVGISSTNNFTDQDKLDYFFHGQINHVYSEDSRINPLFEKYPVFIILDLLSFLILKSQNSARKEFFNIVKSKNIV